VARASFWQRVSQWYLPNIPDLVRRKLISGIVAVAVLFSAAAFLHALLIPPLATGDEALHLDYVVDVSQLQLPRFFDGAHFKVPGAYTPPVQWVSQHPPLYYMILAPFVALADSFGSPGVMVFVGRMLSLIIGLLALLAIPPILARWRQSPRVILGATLLGSVVSMHIGTSSAIYNDPLATLLSVVTVGLAGYILLEGPTRRRVGLLALLAALGLFTRATMLVNVMVACLTLVIAYPLHRQQLGTSIKASLLKGIGAATLTAGLSLVIAGWYYVRNYTYSGSFVGSQTEWAIEHLNRQYFTFGNVLSRPDFIQQYFAGFSSSQIIILSCFVLFAAGIIGTILWSRRHRTHHEKRFLLLIGLIVLHSIGIVLLLAQHIMNGGANNYRYLLPALLATVFLPALGAHYLRWPGKILYLVVFFGGLWTVLYSIFKAETGKLAVYTNGSFDFTMPRSLRELLIVGGLAVICLSVVWVFLSFYRIRKAQFQQKRSILSVPSRLF